MIEDKIRAASSKRQSYGGTKFTPEPEGATPLGQGVPTLKTGVYREFSPMLRKRFELHGRWERATHATWLSLDDMESLWQERAENHLRAAFKIQAAALKEDWPNHATGLFKEERLSLFAVSDLNSESMVLLWLDFEPEPEVWVYDANGESRYKNLEVYLDSYLADDVSAARRSWRA